MYRTGDLARYLGDGNLVFLGRVDHQVKVRGHRIELGEIESVLLSHAGVREAVVVSREESGGALGLVGYVVESGGGVSVGELREYLRSRLPEVMVPSWLVVLPRLPLTANGKVDRGGLPSPESVVREVVAPRNSVERVLVEMWGELLGRRELSVLDNFFELGGHSLLATQVISRVRETFAVEVPLRALFDAPTIAGLAEHVEQSRREGLGLLLPPLLPVSRDAPLPLSFSQQRLWFIDQLEPGSYLYNVPRALRLRGRLNATALRRALDEIVRRHEVLRTNFVTRGDGAVQLICKDTSFPLAEVDLMALPQEQREQEALRLCRQEAMRPFDLSRDRLMRGSLLRLSDDEQILLLTLHHIASDGWSNGVLMRELTCLYNAFQNDHPSPLPELKIQYADYAAWQRAWLQGDALERQITYWRERLNGVPPVLALPLDHPREAATSYRGAMQRFTLPAELSASLRELCRRERVTPFMALLSAFKVLLYQRTGQKDLVVGTDVANRTQPQTEGIIGFFLNHLVLRTDLSGDPSFREVVGRVRETALGAYAHQDLPFEKLVEVLRPERDLSHTPLFQVLFVLDDLPAAAPEMQGLEISSVQNIVPPSKFDLSLFMKDHEQGVQGLWVFRTDLFESESITKLSAQFTTLFAELLADPDRPIEDVPNFSEQERTRDMETERLLQLSLREARRSALDAPQY
jgi:acyl carrier protein